MSNVQLTGMNICKASVGRSVSAATELFISGGDVTRDFSKPEVFPRLDFRILLVPTISPLPASSSSQRALTNLTIRLRYLTTQAHGKFRCEGLKTSLNLLSLQVALFSKDETSSATILLSTRK